MLPPMKKESGETLVKPLFFNRAPQNEPMTPMGSEPKPPYLKILNHILFLFDFVLKGSGFLLPLHSII